jgi:hypothetical protein
MMLVMLVHPRIAPYHVGPPSFSSDMPLIVGGLRVTLDRQTLEGSIMLVHPRIAPYHVGPPSFSSDMPLIVGGLRVTLDRVPLRAFCRMETIVTVVEVSILWYPLIPF